MDVASLACGSVSTVVGFILGMISGLAVWFWRARGIRDMLAQEIKNNLDGLESANGGEWPIRSNYVWESLRGQVPGVLRREEMRAIFEFHYQQARIYRSRNFARMTPEQKAELKSLACETLAKLRRPAE